MKPSTLLLLGLCLGLPACKKKPEEPPTAQQVEGVLKDHKSVELSIQGVNYTQQDIEYFTVNARGGSPIPATAPGLGGGGGVCCLRWFTDATPPVPVTVVWTRDMKRWCTKEVMITGPVPREPSLVVVEFFQDGRVEVELMEDYEELKLRLEHFGRTEKSGNSVLDEKIATCRDSL